MMRCIMVVRSFVSETKGASVDLVGLLLPCSLSMTSFE